MDELAVVNASPIIILARAGLLDLLKLMGEEVLVPEPVHQEIMRHAVDEAVVALTTMGWLRVVEPPVTPPTIAGWDLGDGEASVLAWAHAHPGTTAILDDLAARRCAAALDIPCHGSLGLALLARKRGVHVAARPLVERLRQAGLYLSDNVVNRSLALVGE